MRDVLTGVVRRTGIPAQRSVLIKVESDLSIRLSLVHALACTVQRQGRAIPGCTPILLTLSQQRECCSDCFAEVLSLEPKITKMS